MATCLIVDDSKTIRRAIEKILRELNFHTCEAENGSVALDICATERPEVVMLDWNMPVLDGMEFLKKLRSQPEAHQPKVIFCTTETDFSLIAQALSEGADEYIMKPFDRAILESKLQLVGAL